MRAHFHQHCGPAVDLLGFLESLGFRFELSGDGIQIRVPALLRCMQAHVERVLPAIRLELIARQQKRPGQNETQTGVRPPRPARAALGEPLLHHWERGQWDCYVMMGSLHPVWAGRARNEKQARELARKKWLELSPAVLADETERSDHFEQGSETHARTVEEEE